MTQEQLGERAGCTASTISQIETGKQGFSQDTWLAIAAALNVAPADLLIRNPYDQEPPPIWKAVERAPAEKQREIRMVVEAMLAAMKAANGF